MESGTLEAISEAERTEDAFFAALRASDGDALEDLVGDDMLLVDVNSGAVVDRSAFVGALRERALVFDRVELVERATRSYGDAAVIVGRTEMAGTFADASFAVSSRYTHVFVRGDEGRWRLVNGQGTPILNA
jgi:ketosteroid isomerase-like protein